MTALTYDLVIVGAGTGNALPTEELAGWRIAVIEAARGVLYIHPALTEVVEQALLEL